MNVTLRILFSALLSVAIFSPLAVAKDKATLSLIEPKTIFVTSESYTGDLVSEANTRLGTEFSASEGLEAADALCQDLAEALGSIVPEGEYVALLSTHNVHASVRITPSIGPILRPDGAYVAISAADLFVPSTEPYNASPLINEIALTESADPQNIWAWTGTNQSGTHTDLHCGDWASEEPQNDEGTVGDPASAVVFWLEEDDLACDTEHPIYCVQR